MTQRLCKNTAGFSLIELMFAIMLLTVVVLGVAKLNTGNLGMTAELASEGTAAILARQGLTIIEGMGKSTLAAQSCSASCERSLSMDNNGDYQLKAGPPETIGQVPFTRSIYVEKDTVLPDAYYVAAIVVWEDSQGKHTRYAEKLIYE